MRNLVVIACSTLAISSAQQTKISLSMQNAVHAYGVDWYPPSNASALLDEQQLAGDPAAGSGGVPTTSWETTWDATWYCQPASCQLAPFFFINLNGTYDITSIWAYRGYGHFNVSFQVTDYPANPSQSTGSGVFTVGSPPGQGWISANFTSPARGSYVNFQFSGPTGNSFYELVLYGTPISPAAVVDLPVAPPALPLPPLRDLLGTNGFALDTMHNLSGIVGAIREYDDWDWTEHVQDQNAFQPTADNDFYLDWWYGNLTSVLHVDAHQCMQKSPAWLHNNTSNEEGWKPLTVEQLAIPFSAMNASYYSVVASHAYQVAARYGKVQVPLVNLKLAPNQPPATGLGSMSGLEVFNEVDGTWNGGRNGFFAPYEYAAMLSAAYDGHGGTMGPLMGAKAADPAFPVIHSGLAGVNVDYIEGVRQWSMAYRADKKFPADFLNVHSYCRDPAGSRGVPPENCTLGDELLQLCSYRDAYLPGIPIWLSEFGYDTVGGPSVAPPVAGFSQQEVQAMWLIRTVLMLARLQSPISGGACVSRAHMYMYADVESTSGGVFATSGLVASADFQYAPKVSFFYYSCFMTLFSSATFAGMVTVPGQSDVYAQCFKDSVSGRYSLVVWSGTSTGATLPNVSVPVGLASCPVRTGTSTTMAWTIPAKDAMAGNVTAVPVSGGTSAVVTVTEVPCILSDM